LLVLQHRRASTAGHPHGPLISHPVQPPWTLRTITTAPPPGTDAAGPPNTSVQIRAL